jgi:hypothetical protein
VAVILTVFEKCLRISRLVILISVAMATCIGCANTGSTNVYVIRDVAPAPSGYSAAVLAQRIVPLGIDGA